jgi:hypothetical protein
VRWSIVIVVVVIKEVILKVETWVINGFRNSEQNADALNIIFTGLQILLDV